MIMLGLANENLHAKWAGCPVGLDLIVGRYQQKVQHILIVLLTRLLFVRVCFLVLPTAFMRKQSFRAVTVYIFINL